MKAIRLTAIACTLLAVGVVSPAAVTVSSTVTATAAHATGNQPSGNGAEDEEEKLKQNVSDSEELSEDQATIDAGHVDIGPRLADGETELVARDDTANPPVWRHLDKTVLKVVDQGGKIQMPDDEQYSFIPANAGDDVWVIPQVEQPGVVWLGWNTQNPSFVNEVDGNVTLSLRGVQGPGDLVVYLQNGGFGAPQVVWDDQQRDASVDLNTHTHANWVFTKPGEYLVKMSVSAKTTSGEKLEDTQTIRLAVGDQADVDKAASMQWEGSDDASNESGNNENAEDNTAAGKSDGNSALPLIAAGVGGVFLIAVISVAVMSANARKRKKAAGMDE